MTAPPFLPYGRHWIDDDDVAAATAVLRGDWLTQGPAVEAFEQALASRLGVAHVVACANGTAALWLAYAALDFQPGDAVVVPAITFLATASMARMAGAEVAFADVDPASGLMTPATAEAALARAKARGWRSRALAPVHFAGLAADMDGLAALAEADGLTVVEDACHAVGGAYVRNGAWRPVGKPEPGGTAAFSFHPVKTVAAGEGGAVATDDDAAARRMRRLRNHGMTRDPAEFEDPAGFADGAANPWHYEMPELGFNFRLTDIQSALALSQLRRLEAFVDRRRALRALYADRLADLAPVVTLPPEPAGRRSAWHLCAVQVDFAAAGRRRADVMARMKAAGVGTQVHYIPVDRQPYWRRRYGDPPLPGAGAFFDSALSLPLFPAMADTDVDRAAAALRAALAL